MQFLRAFAGASLLLATGAAQSSDVAPGFEVASIRISQPGGGGREGGHGFDKRENISFAPASVTLRGATLRSCIRAAYKVMDYQVTGPDWIGQERYDIVAKSAGPASEDQLRLMLQNLLAERFKLSFHRQTKEMAAWVLTVGKNGPKFKESVTEGEGNIAPDRQKLEVVVQRTPVSQLVDLLTALLRAPVIDETGLKGKYDMTIKVDKYMPETPTAIVDMLSTIVTGVQQELGLKLDEKKLPLDLLVVDRAEKAPVEN
jgi:uncharacterized protein (TIGR03435 family)